MRGAEVLKQIQKQFSVQISFPKQETGDSAVTLRGRDENVEKAKARIEEIVDEQVERREKVQVLSFLLLQILFQHDAFDESQYIVRREEAPPPKPEPKNIQVVIISKRRMHY